MEIDYFTFEGVKISYNRFTIYENNEVLIDFDIHYGKHLNFHAKEEYIKSKMKDIYALVEELSNNIRKEDNKKEFFAFSTYKNLIEEFYETVKTLKELNYPFDGYENYNFKIRTNLSDSYKVYFRETKLFNFYPKNIADSNTIIYSEQLDRAVEDFKKKQIEIKKNKLIKYLNKEIEFLMRLWLNLTHYS